MCPEIYFPMRILSLALQYNAAFAISVNAAAAAGVAIAIKYFSQH